MPGSHFDDLGLVCLVVAAADVQLEHQKNTNKKFKVIQSPRKVLEHQVKFSCFCLYMEYIWV